VGNLADQFALFRNHRFFLSVPTIHQKLFAGWQYEPEAFVRMAFSLKPPKAAGKFHIRRFGSFQRKFAKT
jgi:hypothetical protein